MLGIIEKKDEAKEKDKGLQFQTGWLQQVLLGFLEKLQEGKGKERSSIPRKQPVWSP